MIEAAWLDRRLVGALGIYFKMLYVVNTPTTAWLRFMGQIDNYHRKDCDPHFIRHSLLIERLRSRLTAQGDEWCPQVV